jgi:uncharacterized protein (TIGR03435 family)
MQTSHVITALWFERSLCRMKAQRAWLLAILAALLPSIAWTQAPPTTPAEHKFEVASIKPNRSDPGARATGMKYGIDPVSGRFTAINTPLEILIFTAYGVLPFEMVGVTDWMKSDRFDVLTSVGDTSNGRPVEATTTKQMLQSLLAERFQLQVHKESREMPLYRLVYARQDKQLGAGIHPSTLGCEAYRMEVERWKAGHAPQPAMKPCGYGGGLGGGIATLRYGGISFRDFTRALAGDVLQRAVVDETGLSGVFDITLNVNPESFPWYGAMAGAFAPTKDAPFIFEALPAQLGLKLEPSRGPVEVLVIDHVEAPTPD